MGSRFREALLSGLHNELVGLHNEYVGSDNEVILWDASVCVLYMRQCPFIVNSLEHDIELSVSLPLDYLSVSAISVSL